MLRFTRLRCAGAAPLFDACFVLNLDRRTDRWQHVQRQIERAKLSQFVAGGVITRVPGVDGRTLDINQLCRDGVVSEAGRDRFNLPANQKLFGMDLTPGALGCALGHRAVWQRIVAENRRCALVLEDDVEFHPRFSRTIAERWSHVPSDFGIMYFGGLDLLAGREGDDGDISGGGGAANKQRPLRARRMVAPGVRLAYEGHRELTAYVLGAAAAQRCLELSVSMTWQIDTHICNELADDVDDGGGGAPKSRYIADPKSYVFQPSLVIQVTSLGTDVQKQPAENPALEDAARRMREFVGGGSSVR